MKKNYFVKGIIITLTVGISSCYLLERNLARRYKNHDENIWDAKIGPATAFAEVTVNSTLVKEANTVTPVYNLLSLTPQGQAELIKSIDGHAGSLGTLINQITTNFNFNKDSKPNVKIIGNKLTKSLVFTIDRKFALPTARGTVILNGKADRIDFLELEVQLAAGSTAIFSSWDRFVTKFANLDLGKVSQSQQFSASLSLNANAGSERSLTGSKSTEDFDSDKETGSVQVVGPIPSGTSTNIETGELLTTGKTINSSGDGRKTTAAIGGSASLSYSDKYETSLDLRSRIIELSGSLSDRRLVIRQESGPGLDLSGNQTILLDYTLTDDWKVIRFSKFKQLYNAGTPVAAAALVNEYQTVIFPNILFPVVGSMSYQFLYRQVIKGSRHIPEARQKVSYKYGQVGKLPALAPPVLVTLINPADVRPKSYELFNIVTGAAFTYNGAPLSFETPLDAENFYHYLGALLNSGGPVAPFMAGGIPLTPLLYNLLGIKTTQL